MKQVITDQRSLRVQVKIWTNDVEERSIEQQTNVANLPFVHHHVAAKQVVYVKG